MPQESPEQERQAQLQEQQLKFESFLLGSVSDSVIAYYPDDPGKGTVVYANESAYRSLGYTREEILQVNILDLITPAWRPVLQKRLEDLSAGREVRGDSEHLRKDGSTFPVEVWLRRVEFGGRSLVVNVSRDITERRQDEKRLREALEAEHKAQERATRELGASRILLEAASTLGETLELREVLQRLGMIMLRLTGTTRVFIASVDTGTWTATPVLVTNREFGHPAGSDVIPFDRLSELAQQAFLDKRTTYLDYDAPSVSAHDRQIAEMNDAHLLLYVPLRIGADMLGHLTIDVPGERREYSLREIELVEGVATQAALALKNARLFQAEREELARTSLLQEVSEAAGSALDPATVAHRVLTAIQGHIGLQAGDVRLLDDAGESLRLIASIGWAETTRRQVAVVPVKDLGWMSSRTLQSRQVLTHEDESPQLTPERQALLREAGVLESRYMALPLVFGESTLGIMSLSFHGKRQFTKDEHALFKGVARSVAQAVWNARVFETEQESAALSASLTDLDQWIHSSLNFTEIAQRALESASRTIGADSCAIDSIVNDVWTVWFDCGFEPSITGHTFTHEQNPHGATAIRTGQTIAIDNAMTDSRVDIDTMKSYGIRSVIVAPLIVRGEAIAALYFNYRHEPHHFTEREIGFVTKVASSLALALENARLYETEHTIAEKLQEALLALPDNVRGVDFSHSYHSAAEAARVGGDFYDIFNLDQDRVAIVVGDVAGKGLDAAVLTSMVKNTVRAHANDSGKTPKQILALTNEVIYKATTSESFVTVFLGILDCTDGRLVYSNAGHTTAAVSDGRGNVGRLSVTGPLLGAFEEAAFAEADTRLEPDELLFLYTDGLTEARRNGEFYGEERLFTFLSSTAAEPSVAIQAVVDDVVAFSGNQLRDDLAILAVKRGEPGPDTPKQQRLEL